AILIALDYVLVRLAFVSPHLDRMLQGTSTTLYEHGRLDRRALRHEAITEEQLVAGLRRQGPEPDDVPRVQLEPQGGFHVTPRPKPKLEDVLAALERIERKLG